MENINQPNSESKNPFPFNNLFLIKGLTSGKNNFRYYLLGIVMAMLGYLIYQSILVLPLISAATSNGIAMDEILKNPNIIFNANVVGLNKSLILALMMGMFVFTLLFFTITIKYAQQKTLNSVITGFEKIRWKRYFFSFSIWSLLLILFTVASYFASPNDLIIQFDFTKFIILVFVAVIFVPIQTATEEIIFRGYLMQGFALVFKNAFMPLILTSVMFGLMHASNPEVKTHGLLLMMPYYILFGLFLGLLTLLDEGLELAMGIHCANNLISSLLICSKSSVLQTDSIFYTSIENPASEILGWIILAAICFFILYKKYNLSNWKLILK